MIIDAHQHFWNYDPQQHAWLNEDLAGIRRDFKPDELALLYKKHGVTGCVAVEANGSPKETDFLLSMAASHDYIKGVVGWIDLGNPAIEKLLEERKHHQKLKGFRHCIEAEEDVNFLLRPPFLNGISALNKEDFTYDILVKPHQLGAVLDFVEKFPKQRFIINHLAKPYIKDGFFSGWATLMTAIAQHENVYCKLSGMTIEADFKNWTSSQIEPYMDLVLNSFGVNRLVFGSDWPVSLAAGNFSKTLNLVATYISKLSKSEQAAIMGLNAITFYKL